jgi:hypothetical protein
MYPDGVVFAAGEAGGRGACMIFARWLDNLVQQGHQIQSSRGERGDMLTADDIEAIQTRIVELQTEHRDLDAVIQRVSETAGHDELLLRRLKKRKLQLKDSITLMQMRLIPDIPA